MARPALPAGYVLAERDRVASTNDEAHRLAETGSGGGTVVWARQQEAGRGRRGRTWASPPGNLYLSLLLTPRVGVAALPQLSLLAAVALGEAVTLLGAPAERVGYKWPNDVLLGGGKVAGILLEGGRWENGEPSWLVLGLGVNVASRPVAGRYGATDLAEEIGHNPGMAAVLATFLERFETWYRSWRGGGFEPVRSAWLSRAVGLGERIEVAVGAGGRPEIGRFVDVDSNGRLVLARDDGSAVALAGGDVAEVNAAA